MKKITRVCDVDGYYKKDKIKRKIKEMPPEFWYAKYKNSSEFNYPSAGGSYKPTKKQIFMAHIILNVIGTKDHKLRHSAFIIKLASKINGMVHHDHIHRINVIKRKIQRIYNI